MTIKTIKTKGMTCPSCEKIIQKAALSVEGVKSAKSDFVNEETTIEFDENITNLENITTTISNKGYKCDLIDNIPQPEETIDGEYYSLPKINSKYLLIAGSILFLLGLFWIIKYSFNFSFPEITPGMGLALVFGIGILTSFHCVGMCGGFVLSYTTKEAMNRSENMIIRHMTRLPLLFDLSFFVSIDSFLILVLFGSSPVKVLGPPMNISHLGQNKRSFFIISSLLQNGHFLLINWSFLLPQNIFIEFRIALSR